MNNASVDYKEFNADLQRHLMKCELEYRAKVLPGGSCVDWLVEHCESVIELADFLRSLGFRIKEVMNDQTSVNDEWMRWVETTSGVLVYVNEPYLRGFVSQAARKRNIRR